MSYDVSLIIRTGPDSWATVCNGWNYTSNLGGLFVWAYGEPFGKTMDGISATKASEILRKVIKKIESESTENLQKFNPENNWGNWVTFLEFLKEIKVACDENQYCKVSVYY